MPLVGMPSSQSVSPEELYVCPYDPVHRIRAQKWTIHLEKCRKNHPDVELWTCVFNARHKVPLAMRRHHMTQCPDSHTISQDISYSMTSDVNYLKGNTAVPPYTHEFPIEGTNEDWDAECADDYPPHYSPYSPLHDTPIFRDTTGLKKSEKKKIHQRQVLECERVSRGLPKEPQPGDPDYADYVEEQREREATLDSASLRKPRGPSQAIVMGTMTGYGANVAGLVKRPVGRGQLAQHIVQSQQRNGDQLRKPNTPGIANTLPFTATGGRTIAIGRGAALYTRVPTHPPQLLPTHPPQLLPTHPPQLLPTHPPQLLPTHPPQLLPTQPPQLLPTQPSSTSVRKPLPPGMIGDDTVGKQKVAYTIGSSDSSSDSNQDDADMLRHREIRKLKKKLREIECLNTVVESGGDLTREQVLKINQETTLTQQLSALLEN